MASPAAAPAAGPGGAWPAARAKVFFVGNSYTYFNNLVHCVLHIKPEPSGAADNPAVTLRIASLLEGGMGLFDLAEDFVRMLPAVDPDVVVLQDQSSTPAGYHPSEGGGAAAAAVGSRRAATIALLRERYAPALRAWAGGWRERRRLGAQGAEGLPFAAPRVIFYSQWARSAKMMERPADYNLLGAPFATELAMLEALEAGYAQYAAAISGGPPGGGVDQSAAPFTVEIAPVGRAVYALRQALLALPAERLAGLRGGEDEAQAAAAAGAPDAQREALAESVYQPNDMFAHPSALGTLLVGFVLVRTLFEGRRAARPRMPYDRMCAGAPGELCELAREVANSSPAFAGAGGEGGRGGDATAASAKRPRLAAGRADGGADA